MSTLHRLTYHTYTREFDTQSGVIYLSPARKAWKRRNELLVDPEPTILIDFSQWRTELGDQAQVWSESALSYQLSNHPLTRIHPPRVDWLAPVRKTSEQVAALGTLVVTGVTRTSHVAKDAVVFTINIPLSFAKVTHNAVVSSAQWSWGVGEAVLHALGELLPSRETLATLTRWSSHLALSFSVALMLLFAGPVVILNTQDLLSKANISIPRVQLPFQENGPGEATPTPTPQPVIGSAEDVFSISVPELNIHSTITPNVDPGNEKEYTAALKKGIAHAAGSALPEQYDYTKTVYLFAHSTDAPWNIARYNAQFYELKNAKPGQEIKVRFWGKDYHYVIESTEIIDAQDVTHLQPQMDEERLVLQTCYPPGTTWKRLLVIAKPVANTEDASVQSPLPSTEVKL